MLLLANHGTVSCGKTLEEALDRTEILESYCRTLLLARPLGPVQRLSDQNMRDLMALKQRLGLPDRRASRESFDDCDLCGNNVFGRGFCEGHMSSPITSVRETEFAARKEPGMESSDPVSSTDLHEIVREIADQVIAAMKQ